MGPDNSLDWARDGQSWPNREASRFVEAAGIRWHLQEMGAGPLVLLIHGTGAATHSWRGLAPLLAPHVRLLAIDLPGHGFTQKPPQKLYTLPGMAAGVCELLHVLSETPEMVAGHSAGAAVMLRMALDCRIAPKGLVSLNGALKPYGGDAARWLSPVAKVLFLNPLMPRLFAWQAGDRRSVERLIRNTGSTPDPEGVEHYRTLVANSNHVAAALGMMANWDLQPLSRDMAMLDVPLLLIAGQNDKAIKGRGRVRGARHGAEGEGRDPARPGAPSPRGGAGPGGGPDSGVRARGGGWWRIKVAAANSTSPPTT